MVSHVKAIRTMDVHLLSKVDDDESPFGVEFTTRRLTLETSGVVSCDVAEDLLWMELAAGIPARPGEVSEVVTPGDGARFLDRILDFFRYEYLSPSTPLVYDHRGTWRPDNFRIKWKPSTRLYWGHGYQFLCERTEDQRSDGVVPVAMLEGWEFYHAVGRLEGITEGPGRPAPRQVVVNLLPQRNAAWEETVMGRKAGPRQTKALLRAFLRRFFERCMIGSFPEAVGHRRPFSWRGGF
jgi:hypothetical protein